MMKTMMMMRQSLLLALLLLLLPAQAHLRKKGRTLIRKRDVFVDPMDVLLHAAKKKKTKDCLPKHKKSGKGKTTAPTVSPAPSQSAYCPTLQSACALLEREEVSFDEATYVIDFSLAITGDVEDVLDTLEDFLEEEFRSLTACADYDVRRRLQETNLLATDVDVTEDATATESACPAGATCLGVQVEVEATHDEGDTVLIGEVLLQALTDRCDAIQALEGIADTYDPCPTMSITPGAGVETPGDGTGGGVVTPGDGTDGGGSTPGDGTDGGGSTPGDGTDGGGSTPGDGTDGGGSTPGDGTDGGGSTPGDGTDGEGSTPGTGDDPSTDGGGTDGGGDADPGDGFTEGGGDDSDKDGADDGGDSGFAAVVDERSSEDGVETGGYITIALSALVLLLLLLFAVRRRNEYHSSFTHKQFVNEGGDYDDDDSTYAKGSSEEDSHQERNVHVVGEADSVFSGWTGYTGDRDRGGLHSDGGSQSNTPQYQDVHKCSSATCELCEAKRRSGLQFVPTKMPSHSSHLPSNSSRRYLTQDTVHL